MDVSVGEKEEFGFGLFLLDPVRRRLTHRGTPVKMTPTRFDTLHYLVANAGRVVEKDELMAAIWPGRIMEEANLTQTISYLRRTLQDIEPGAERYIATAPGRGYRFAETVRREHPTASPPSATAPGATGPAQHLPHEPAPARLAPPARKPWPARIAVAIAALAATALLAWALLPPPAPRFDPPPRSVAVLAFTNLSGGKDQDYFADGMSEELIDTLSRIDGVSVTGRLSAFSFKGRIVTIPQIARALNVRAVLEGSVRRDGAHLRIRARLVDGITGLQIWARTYDRTLSDTLALQTDIASGVASSLAVTLAGAGSRRLTAGKTSNPRAFEAYLRATGLIRFYTRDSLQAAVAAYEEAIRNDPAFADAYAGHAIVQARIAVDWKADAAAAQNALRQSLAEADQAISLAPELAEAHTARAVLLAMSLDFRDSETEIHRARELGPGILEVERQYVVIERSVGHTQEAVAAAQHLAALDPLTSGVYLWLAGAQMANRQYDDALVSLRTESALGAADPHRSAVLRATVHLGMGQPEAAILDCQSIHVEPGDTFDALLAIAYTRLGQQEEAARALARWRAVNGANDFGTLLLYANLGNLKNALRAVNALYAAHDTNLLDLKVNPLLDPIRATPEFRSIEAAMNYPP